MHPSEVLHFSQIIARLRLKHILTFEASTSAVILHMTCKTYTFNLEPLLPYLKRTDAFVDRVCSMKMRSEGPGRFVLEIGRLPFDAKVLDGLAQFEHTSHEISQQNLKSSSTFFHTLIGKECLRTIDDVLFSNILSG